MTFVTWFKPYLKAMCGMKNDRNEAGTISNIVVGIIYASNIPETTKAVVANITTVVFFVKDKIKNILLM